MPPSFLVIGSNSFSGASFVRHLLEQGYQVLGVSRSEEPHPTLLPYKWLISGRERFLFQRIDLNYDLDRLLELIYAHAPEYIVNFAAQGMVAESWQIPEHWYQTNVVAQVRLHDRLRKLNFLKKYVHVTTPEVYGSTDGWTKEHFQFSPSTPYAVSRAACDLHLMSFFKAYGFPVVFTRASNVYGPGQRLYRIIPKAMLFAKTGRKLLLHGGGLSVRSFIHIQDVADATLKVALRGTPGKAYHISARSAVAIRELVQHICQICKISFENLVEIGSDRLGKDQAYLLDSDAIRTELGWIDRISLQEGLSQTLAWVDENLDVLSCQETEYKHMA